MNKMSGLFVLRQERTKSPPIYYIRKKSLETLKNFEISEKNVRIKTIGGRFMKIWKTIIASCILLTATGCSNNSASATEVVTSFLNAYHDRDNKQLQEHSNWESFDVTSLDLKDEDYLSGVDQQLQLEVYQKMMEFKHEEKEEKIDGDKAVVTVTLTIYDFTPVVEAGLKQATTKAEELSQQKDVSDEQIQSQILTILFENMNKAEQTKTITTTVNVIKKNNQWIVSDSNDDLRDALLQNSNAVEKIA